jgi:hypothetical protein
MAETLAYQIFAGIRVKLQWHRPSLCPASAVDPVFLILRAHTPEAYFPGALGVALPLEGRHAWVFYDRVQRAAWDDKHLTALLAHVLAHEVAHLLQGTIRHSESGILKARWSDWEIAQMAILPLAFTPSDALLVQQGAEKRRSHAVSNPFTRVPTDRSDGTSLASEGALAVP